MCGIVLIHCDTLIDTKWYGGVDGFELVSRAPIMCED